MQVEPLEPESQALLRLNSPSETDPDAFNQNVIVNIKSSNKNFET